MTFLKFQTNSLNSLVDGLTGNSIWEKIGSSTRTINLIRDSKNLVIGEADSVTGKIAYLIPIEDSNKADIFKTECNKFGITVEVIEEAIAQTYADEFRAAKDSTAV